MASILRCMIGKRWHDPAEPLNAAPHRDRGDLRHALEVLNVNLSMSVTEIESVRSRARAEASKLEFGSLPDHVPRHLEWLHEQRVTTADGKRVTVASIKVRHHRSS